MAEVSGTSSGRRYGGFDVLRIVAALCVVLTHSFSLTGHSDARPIMNVGRYSVAMGTLGVSMFFVISGFLVTQSWERSGRASSFVRNRFARIWPGLTTVVLLTVVVLGPAMTTLSLVSYVGDRGTLEYAWRNLTLVLGPDFRLPGVFTSTPDGGVNGSLWTMPYEIWCYVGLLLLGVFGLLRFRWIAIVVALTGLLLFRFGTYGGQIPLRYGSFGVTMKGFTEMGSYFFLGAVMAMHRDRIRLGRLVVPASMAILVGFVAGEPVFFMVGLAGVVVGIGVAGNRVTESVSRLGDPSYGIYIMSFPIQQVLYQLGVARTSWVMFAWSASISAALGYASWHFVERPAMRRLKPHRTVQQLETVG